MKTIQEKRRLLFDYFDRKQIDYEFGTLQECDAYNNKTISC